MASEDRRTRRRLSRIAVWAAGLALAGLVLLLGAGLLQREIPATPVQAADCTPPPANRPPIFPERVAELHGARISYESSVTSGDRTMIEQGLAGAGSYLREALGFELTDVCIDVYVSSSAVAGRAETNGSRVALFTTPEGWPSPTSAQLALVTAHELMHVWQFALAGDYAGAEPAWLVEGSADVLAFEVMLREGIMDAEAIASRTALPSGPLIARMSAIESYQVLRGVFPQQRLAVVATKLLTDQYGAPALRDFWSRLGQGTAWDRAFEDVYGVTPATFYAGVDEYVRGGPVPLLPAPYTGALP